MDMHAKEQFLPLHYLAPKQPVGQFISIPKITVSLCICFPLSLYNCSVCMVQYFVFCILMFYFSSPLMPIVYCTLIVLILFKKKILCVLYILHRIFK